MPIDYDSSVHGEAPSLPLELEDSPVNAVGPMDYDEQIHGPVDMPAKEPTTYYGEDAISQVVEREGELTPAQRAIVMEEGFVDGEYADTKGISTVGVGQTGEFKDMSFKDSFEIQQQRAKRYIKDFDNLPEEMQTELMIAQYRGDLGGSPAFRRLINEGNYADAAEEYLDNKEYQDPNTPTGIKKRFERMYDYLVTLAPKDGNPEETSEEPETPELKPLQDGFYEDDAGETVEVRNGTPYTSTGDVLTGFAEVGLSGLGAAAGEIGGGLAGLLTSAITGDLSKGAETVANVQKALAYQPKTAEGKAIMEALGSAMEPVMKELEAYKAQTQEGLEAAGYGEGVQALAGAQQDALMATAGMTPAGKVAGATKLGKLEFEVGDIGATGPGKKQAGMMAGVQAKNADMDSFAEAQKRIDAGEDVEKVRKETGWWKHDDGTMRFEFSDADSEMVLPPRKEIKTNTYASMSGFSNTNNQKFPYKLGDLFKHDKLFENYPEAKNFRVGFYDEPNNRIGGFAAGTGRHIAMNLSGRDLTDPAVLDDIRSVMLHEIAHTIQGKEGFTRGGSSGGHLENSLMDEGISSISQFHATQTKKTQKAFDTAFPNGSFTVDPNYAGFASLMKHIALYGPEGGRKFANMLRSKGSLADADHFEEFAKTSMGSQRMQNLYNGLSDAAKRQFIADLTTVEKQYLKHDVAAEAKYYQTLGEIDARNVQHRMDFSEETLREVSPETSSDMSYKYSRDRYGDRIWSK